jgi:uncharacterized protein (DUF362 family)/Pyruvate/2-oxoacid:ferredoxin oxidoreductase delta subunit
MSTVSLVRCSGYDTATVDAAVRAAVDQLGGIGRFVLPGQNVVVKPNLLRSSKPDAAIVTHPAVVRAVVRLVQEAGGKVTLLDSPGGPANAAYVRRAYREAGWEQVASETGATLGLDFTSEPLLSPEGKLIKRFDIIGAVARADCVITLPKLKTHGLVRFTGATKILFGVIPGLQKIGYHTRFQNADHFSEMLLDLLLSVKPRLSIMDAVVAMEGKGPAAGQPRNVNAILASEDSIALDVIASTMVGIPPLSIPIIKAAAARGLTSGNPADVQVVGEDPASLRVPDFLPPPVNPRVGSMPSGLPVGLRTWINDQLLLTPRADPRRCTGCQTCYASCPVQAITMVQKKAVMDSKKCIRCYCCHELCPDNAIDLHRGRLGRLLIRDNNRGSI